MQAFSGILSSAGGRIRAVHQAPTFCMWQASAFDSFALGGHYLSVDDTVRETEARTDK